MIELIELYIGNTTYVIPVWPSVDSSSSSLSLSLISIFVDRSNWFDNLLYPVSFPVFEFNFEGFFCFSALKINITIIRAIYL